jgi:hypothetical protein
MRARPQLVAVLAPTVPPARPQSTPSQHAPTVPQARPQLVAVHAPTASLASSRLTLHSHPVMTALLASSRLTLHSHLTALAPTVKPAKPRLWDKRLAKVLLSACFVQWASTVQTTLVLVSHVLRTHTKPLLVSKGMANVKTAHLALIRTPGPMRNQARPQLSHVSAHKDTVAQTVLVRARLAALALSNPHSDLKNAKQCWPALKLLPRVPTTSPSLLCLFGLGRSLAQLAHYRQNLALMLAPGVNQGTFLSPAPSHVLHACLGTQIRSQTKLLCQHVLRVKAVISPPLVVRLLVTRVRRAAQHHARLHCAKRARPALKQIQIKVAAYLVRLVTFQCPAAIASGKYLL